MAGYLPLSCPKKTKTTRMKNLISIISSSSKHTGTLIMKKYIMYSNFIRPNFYYRSKNRGRYHLHHCRYR